MRIAIAQLNPTVGDLKANCEQILAASRRAEGEGAELVLTPELAVCGYPPKDLLLRSGFVNDCEAAVQWLATQLPPKMGLLVGHPARDAGGALANSASLLADGHLQQTIHKTLLPNYDVFDEQRYFRPGAERRVIEFGGLRFGVHICEDAWYGVRDTFYHAEPTCLADPIAELVEQGCEWLVNLSASPFELGKLQRRQEIFARHARQHGKLFLCCNQVGGNDDLVFDGHSFVLNEQGEFLHIANGFAEDLLMVDTEHLPSSTIEPDNNRIATLHDALVLGLKDYMRKCGFQDCILGLSGGIDSAIAVCLAERAVGKEHVHALMMPSRYSTDHSVGDAQALADNLGIDAQLIAIKQIHEAYTQAEIVGPELRRNAGGLADQNLQARIRGALVMIRSNHHGWLALATGNKSELAVGYCTLYGDMAGGFAVLCDVYKRDVYRLAEYINATHPGGAVIPENIIHKAPSAELAPDQFDQDSLPEYDMLDGILDQLIDQERSVAQVSEMYPPETVDWVRKKLDRNEFKRRQMPPGIKLSRRAFGTGRRMPMAANYRGIDSK